MYIEYVESEMIFEKNYISCQKHIYNMCFKLKLGLN